jgi:hypothetical protein
MALLAFLHLAILSNLVLGVNVSIPLAPPSTAPTVTPSLVSFSIEQDRWTDWVGTTSRNQFFFNTLDNLNQLAGVPPRIRIGADSEDHTNYNPAVQVKSNDLTNRRIYSNTITSSSPRISSLQSLPPFLTQKPVI